MRLMAFLNELSHPNNGFSNEQVRLAVINLITVLRRIKEVRPNLEFHSLQPLLSIDLGEHRTIKSVCQGGDRREEWQFLRSMENRGFDLAREILDLAVDYSYNGKSCVGLALAHELDSVAVSFEGVNWQDSSVQLVCSSLHEDATVAESEVSVRHAACDAHVVELKEWLSTMPFPQFRDGVDLWTNRSYNFSSLVFLPKTEKQITSLKRGSLELAAIASRLWELDNAAKNKWKKDQQRPNFLSFVTAEYEGRKKDCQFESFSSGVQSFDYHARYTPGAGRIHIWCNKENHSIEIGHVGEKM